MGRRAKALAGCIAVCAGVAVAPSFAAGSAAPNLRWTELIPPFSSPSAPQPHAVRFCRKATLRCVDRQIRRMRRAQRRFGCDHRGVFATTYLELTRELRRRVRHDPHVFRFPRYLLFEDALFANWYFRTLRAWDRGERVPPAWRIALSTAQHGSVLGAQDMLLGINAHVQNDMPFVLASLGLRNRRGESRKPDHDWANQILNDAYERVVRAVRYRFDPTVGITNSELTPVDDLAGLELARTWREGVWRNAERLVNADSPAERRAVGRSIERDAAMWARGIAALEFPGHRAERDAYCRARRAAHRGGRG